MSAIQCVRMLLTEVDNSKALSVSFDRSLYPRVLEGSSHGRWVAGLCLFLAGLFVGVKYFAVWWRRRRGSCFARWHLCAAAPNTLLCCWLFNIVFWVLWVLLAGARLWLCLVCSMSLGRICCGPRFAFFLLCICCASFLAWLRWILCWGCDDESGFFYVLLSWNSWQGRHVGFILSVFNLCCQKPSCFLLNTFMCNDWFNYLIISCGFFLCSFMSFLFLSVSKKLTNKGVSCL